MAKVRPGSTGILPVLVSALAMLLLAGCQQKMAKQPYYRPLAGSDYFPDGRAARTLPEGTVARGELHEDELFWTGRVSNLRDGAPAVKLVSYAPRPNLAPMTYTAEFPFPITREVLERGQERYTIFCAVCHDPLGTAKGIVVRRGFTAPPSYHEERLRDAPVGYYFSTMTYGFGSMPDYAAQVPPRDRWAIAAYIRALQLSQSVKLADLSEEDRNRVLQSVEKTSGTAR